MPAKNPPTEEDLKTKVRQEGRRGHVHVSEEFITEHGKEKLKEIFDHIKFQVFAVFKGNTKLAKRYYGYCPLFAPLTIDEKTKHYVMRVELKEPDPIIEMLEMKGM